MKHSLHSVTLHDNILWVIDITGIYWAVLLPSLSQEGQPVPLQLMLYIRIQLDRKWQENWVRKLRNTIESISIQWHKTKTITNIVVYHETCDNWYCVLILIDTAEWVECTAEERNGLLCYCRQWWTFRPLLCFWSLCTLWHWTDFNTEGSKLLFLILRKSECSSHCSKRNWTREKKKWCNKIVFCSNATY